MANENRKILLIVGMVILALAIVKYSNLFAVSFTPSQMDFVQDGITSNFSLGNNIFRFEPTRESSCGNDYGGSCYPTGCAILRCCEQIRVYKDNVLIQTLGAGWGGSLDYQNTNTSMTYYSDSGYKITINLNTARLFQHPSCQSMKNDFAISLPENSFSIDTQTLQSKYNVGDNVKINISVHSAIDGVSANLTLIYKVNTIIGQITKSDYAIINLTKGNNVHQLTIPSNLVTSVFEITPVVQILYPTTGISGVSFGGQDVKNIEYISLGKFQGNSTVIYISNDTITFVPVNQTVYVYQNGTAVNNTVYQNQTVEITKEVPYQQTIWDKYGLASIVAILLITIIIWMVLKRK